MDLYTSKPLPRTNEAIDRFQIQGSLSIGWHTVLVRGRLWHELAHRPAQYPTRNRLFARDMPALLMSRTCLDIPQKIFLFCGMHI